MVPGEVFARFANNAFAVLRAAWAKGLLNVHERVPATLERSSLVGRSATVDEGLLAQLADHFGPERVALMVTAAVAPGQVLISGGQNSETLIGGLINYFPVECRPDLSFTTGLQMSPRRPFHIVPTKLDAAEQRRISREGGISIIDLASTDFDCQQLRGWGRYVAEAISTDQLSALINQLQLARPGLSLSQLDALGEELIHRLTRVQVACGQNADDRASPARRSIRSVKPAEDSEAIIRRDLPAIRAESPAAQKLPDPMSAELFEQLDEVVYEAINGSSAAATQVGKLWTQLSAHLSADAISEAREQYLRYTLTLWDTSVGGSRDPNKAIRALDVLSILMPAN